MSRVFSHIFVFFYALKVIDLFNFLYPPTLQANGLPLFSVMGLKYNSSIMFCQESLSVLTLLLMLFSQPGRAP
jgi:hypothetical protein